jgi:RNA polymerase sigma-70 factor (ECF subfamily)
MENLPRTLPTPPVKCSCGECELGNEITDAQMVDAMKAGEVLALGELYNRHAPAVYGLCLYLLKDQAKAEALLEEAFWKLWQNRSHLRSPLDSVLKCVLGFAASRANRALSPGAMCLSLAGAGEIEISESTKNAGGNP